MSLTVSLLVLLFISGVVAQDGWGVDYKDKSICALKGSTVTMRCTYTYPSGQFVQKAFWTKQWGRGSESADLLDDPDYRGRVQYLGDKQHDCTLRLRNVRETDQSIYYFRFLTDQSQGNYEGAGGVNLSVTDLQVEVPERVIEGDEVTLTCKTSFSLSDRPTFTWYRNGHPLSSSTDQLHLQLVSREDADRYRCAVLGLRSPEVTLNVRYGPKSVSVSISPSGEIVEGRSVTLTCSSDANPPVEYNWIKGTSSVGKGETYTMMEISSVDSGEYKCRSSNEHGEKLSEALTLNVLYPPKSVSVSISPSGETAEGSSVNLTCSSDANPPVQNYTWFKEGGSSPVGSGHSYRAPQRGSYYCEAQNEHGSQKSAAVTVKGVWNSALYAVIGVTAGCGCLSIIIAVFCVRRKRRGSSADDKNQTQNVDPNAKDDTNTALDPVSRTSDDVYNTLATVHSSPSDDLYSALDPQSRSPEYGTLATVRNKH
uniref:Ig-like domain-containing protein n=1 Tax=Pygocentrus nattereri TaxID=42514 RepID=A0AAR2J208_PYGNA